LPPITLELRVGGVACGEAVRSGCRRDTEDPEGERYVRSLRS
jgi:hypothetical protein